METRLRASHEQFSIMLDFMETHGDLSRPQQGHQGRLRNEQLWNELAEMLNFVGGTGVVKQADRWKRVWSDWKTKTKKKAASINKNIAETGVGSKPLNFFEERVLRIIASQAVNGNHEVQEASFEVIPSSPSSYQSMQLEQETSQKLELPSSPESSIVEMVESTSDAVPFGTDTGRQREAANSAGTRLEPPITPEPRLILNEASKSHRNPGQSGPARSSARQTNPHGRRVFRQWRRRNQIASELASKRFAEIEEGRLRLEEKRIEMEHEREMERLRVESQRIEMEDRRTNTIVRLIDIGNNILNLLFRPQTESIN